MERKVSLGWLGVGAVWAVASAIMILALAMENIVYGQLALAACIVAAMLTVYGFVASLKRHMVRSHVTADIEEYLRRNEA